jgi:hypothetical protein
MVAAQIRDTRQYAKPFAHVGCVQSPEISGKRGGLYKKGILSFIDEAGPLSAV